MLSVVKAVEDIERRQGSGRYRVSVGQRKIPSVVKVVKDIESHNDRLMLLLVAGLIVSRWWSPAPAGINVSVRD